MKKTSIASISFLFIFMVAIGNISAASYSKTQTAPVTITNVSFRLSGTAAYTTAGDIRWSYGKGSLLF